MPDLADHYGYALEDFDRAVYRAITDPDFRRRMLAEPKEAFAAEGVEFPASVRVTVHEFDPDDRHYILPPAAMTELGVAHAFMLRNAEEVR
jgi:hypothetical protein